MNDRQKQARIKKLLERISPENNIESISKPHSSMESVGRRGFSEADEALRRVARDEPLNQEQMRALEAIIIPGERPVVDIKNDHYDRPPAPFSHFHSREIRDKIEPAIKAIGRVELPNHRSLPYGGTAFLVGDGLMMTNRHVAEIFATGIGREGLTFRGDLKAGIDLKQEVESADEPVVFDVEDILMVHPYWDMALIRVQGLGHIVPLSLSTLDPNEFLHEDVAVIGYPALDVRNEIDLQNEIFRGKFNVKRMQPGKIGQRAPLESYGNRVDTVTHDSSTLGGNSGSAVVHAKTGKVIALHFAGIYLDANYAVPTSELAKDRNVVDAEVHFNGPLNPQPTLWDHLWNEADGKFEAHAGQQLPINTNTSTTVSMNGANVGGSSVTWSIPLHVTVQVGQVTSMGAATNPSGSSPSSSASSSPGVLSGVSSSASSSDAAIEKLVEPIHSDDYSDRDGYDEEFLGIKLRLPKIRTKRIISQMQDGKAVVPYRNFSLVMHKTRRLAIYTACNIDGRHHKRRPEPGLYTRKALANMQENDREKWFNDPRILDEHQLPNVFYDLDRKAFDKGHLVRRDDVTWGDSYSEIQLANGDTFHVTNCSPQVAAFNRSNKSGIWGKLENEVLKQAKRDEEMYSVFAGPILATSDPIFEGEDDDFLIEVQIPTSFWKVIVVNNDNVLEGYAFLLEQDLADVDFDDGRELAFNDNWKQHLVSMTELEERIDLIEFPKELHKSDMFEQVRRG